jgi:hypothetical protein
MDLRRFGTAGKQPVEERIETLRDIHREPHLPARGADLNRNIATSALDLHRVPRQIHVDHHVAELQVAALTGRLSGQQDRHVAREFRDRGVLVAPGQAAVVAGRRVPAAATSAAIASSPAGTR